MGSVIGASTSVDLSSCWLDLTLVDPEPEKCGHFEVILPGPTPTAAMGHRQVGGGWQKRRGLQWSTAVMFQPIFPSSPWFCRPTVDLWQYIVGLECPYYLLILGDLLLLVVIMINQSEWTPILDALWLVWKQFN